VKRAGKSTPFFISPSCRTGQKTDFVKHGAFCTKRQNLGTKRTFCTERSGAQCWQSDTGRLESAVNGHDLTGDKGRLVRDKEHDHFRQFKL
jgi:hypothetical protein